MNRRNFARGRLAFARSDCRDDDQVGPLVPVCQAVSAPLCQPYNTWHRKPERIATWELVENNRIERAGLMLWVGLIGGLLVCVLVMYGIWLLVKRLDD